MTRWQQLNIYINETDSWHHQPLYTALMETARDRFLAGVTVTRASAGFGESRRIRTTNIMAVSADLPLVVTVIDREDAIASFLPIVRSMVKSGLICLQTVEVLEPVLH